MLSDRGLRKALSYNSKRPDAKIAEENGSPKVPVFLAANNLKPFIPSGFSMPPISYRHLVNNRVFEGYDATLLSGPKCRVKWPDVKSPTIFTAP